MKKGFNKKGQFNGAVGAIVMLVTGVGVASLVMIFVSSLGGQTYNLVEPDILAISNTNISNAIIDSVTNMFKAQSQTASYMPLIVLAVIIAIVLSLVLGMGVLGNGHNGGSAL